MAEFVLKNIYFEFNGSIKQKLSGTTIGTKFAPPYVCIFMDKLETNFLKTQTLRPLMWFRYIDGVFFLWIHGEENLKRFLDKRNNYDPYIKFTQEYSKKEIPFLDLKVGFKIDNITTDLYVKGTTYKTNYKFDCNEKCLIYLITYNKCFKQYKGQTVDTFSRWNNYKDNARKYERSQYCMQKHLYEHFDLPGHTNLLEDVTVTFTDKTDPRDPTEREVYWIYTLKTKAPMGLNMENGFLY